MSIYNSDTKLLGPGIDHDNIVIENTVEELEKAKGEWGTVTSWELSRDDLAALMEGKALKLTGNRECMLVEFNPIRK